MKFIAIIASYSIETIVYSKNKEIKCIFCILTKAN